MFEPAQIFRGEVVHKRVRPKEHKLRYRVFSLLVDVDRIGEIDATLNLFSLNRLNLFSIREKDHGFRDERSLSEFAWTIVKQAQLEDQISSIQVLLYPRIFGFAFNPLTVYFCLDENRQPVLMIYEVRNTFGESLTYVLEAGALNNGAFSHRTEKQFYVSPFNDVDGHYTFHVRLGHENITVGVALKTEDKPLLRTHFKATAHPLSDGALIKMLFTYPLMTLKIVAGIHWEALKLWRKGLSLKDRPKAPEQRVVWNVK